MREAGDIGMVNVDFFSGDATLWGMHLRRRFIYQSTGNHLKKISLHRIFDPLLWSRVIGLQSCDFWLAEGRFLAKSGGLRSTEPQGDVPEKNFCWQSWRGPIADYRWHH